mmetsp:Transcript_6513/g.27719  ORF Transcript_6513/g.27719 Transcript_6513/m.27719 type:complete len:86 (-) Transcript_6513:4126-4383(-)
MLKFLPQGRLSNSEASKPLEALKNARTMEHFSQFASQGPTTTFLINQNSSQCNTTRNKKTPTTVSKARVTEYWVPTMAPDTGSGR